MHESSRESDGGSEGKRLGRLKDGPRLEGLAISVSLDSCELPVFLESFLVSVESILEGN